MRDAADEVSPLKCINANARTVGYLNDTPINNRLACFVGDSGDSGAPLH